MTIDAVVLIVSVVCIVAGAIFFLAGTVGMLRFPDVYTRLHAMTKADNLGIGFVAVGLVVVAPGWTEAVKLILSWIFILMAATTAAHLVAQSALRAGIEAVDTTEPANTDAGQHQ